MVAATFRLRINAHLEPAATDIRREGIGRKLTCHGKINKIAVRWTAICKTKGSTYGVDLLIAQISKT